MDANRERMNRNRSAGLRAWRGMIEEAVSLLPTPNATDCKGIGQPPGRERDGRERPSSDADLPTAVSLLRTPTAQLASNGGSQHPDKRKAGGHGPTLADEVEHLLPTPAARDWKSGQSNLIGTNARPLSEVVEMTFLPTPRATDGTKGGPNQRGSSGDLMLPSAVMDLLPTPQATDAQGGPRAVPQKRTHRGKDHGPRLRDMAPALLPTPSAADAAGGHKTRSGNRSGEPLLGGIAMLLPTPTAMDSHGARNATAARKDPKPATQTAGWTLGDVFWTGDHTNPRSAAGRPASDGRRHIQLSLDGQEND